MAKKKKKNYIDNKRFEKLIQQYLKDPKPAEDELFAMFGLLIDNIITGFKFNVSIEDATQDCFLLILKTLKNFDKTRGNAFSYFTSVVLNHLSLIYTKAKKYNEKIVAYTEYVTGRPSSNPSGL